MRRVSWGAIFAGLFVTIVAQMILTLLGAAVGAATINPMTQSNPVKGLGTGAAIWLVISSLISLFCGAYVAGRLSGGPRRSDGLFHGILTFSVAEVAMMLILTSAAGALLGGGGSLLGNLFSSNASSDEEKGQMFSAVQDQIQQNLPQAGTVLPPTGRSESQQTPGELTGLASQDPELASALARFTAKGGASQAPQERDKVIDLLTTKHGMDQEQAATLVNQWDQSYQQVKGQTELQARQTGEKVAHGVSKGALWGFIGMILGLGAAAWGGWVGTASLPRYDRPETSAAS
jgi:hypothetical protein